MFNIREYSQFFIKKSFDLPAYKPKKKIKVAEKYDYLFYEIFHKIHNLDSTSFIPYIERQEKMKIAESLEKIKMKSHDFILNNIMYDFNIHLITLNAICIFYKINLLFIKDATYIKMFHSESEKVLVMNDKYKFINYDPGIYDTHYEVTNLLKPLNSVSYYKVDELVTIAQKIHIPYEKVKKKDLYDSIYNYLVKLNIFKID